MHSIVKYDPSLAGSSADLDLRMANYHRKLAELTADGQTLSQFATGYLYFGFHKAPDGWYYREWAPGADRIFLMLFAADAAQDPFSISAILLSLNP